MDKTENSATNSTSSRLTKNEAKISFLLKDVEIYNIDLKREIKILYPNK